jgi:hypothetical protein
MLLRAYFGKTSDTLGIERFIREDVSARIPGFTIFETLGYWKGTREPSFVLETVASEDECEQVRGSLETLARLYCERFAQECVLVVGLPSETPSFVSSLSDNSKEVA